MTDTSDTIKITDNEERPLRKGERTIQRALDAAEQLFADQGYEGTTVRQIADAIDIREPSLYKHFQGKDAIYAAVLERGTKPLVDEIEGWLANQLTLNDLLIIPTKMNELLAQHPNLARLLQREMMASEISPVALQWFQQLFGRGVELTRNFISEPQMEKQSLLYVIALTNVALGYYSSASLFKQLDMEDLLDPETIDQQSEVFTKIFKTFLIN